MGLDMKTKKKICGELYRRYQKAGKKGKARILDEHTQTLGYPTLRLIAKEKPPSGRYKKIYEKEPKTPYQRLLESPDVSDECKAELRLRAALLNPVALKHELDKARDNLLKLSARILTYEAHFFRLDFILRQYVPYRSRVEGFYTSLKSEASTRADDRRLV